MSTQVSAKEYFVIDLIKSSKENTFSIYTYQNSLLEIVKSYNGRQMVSPIQVVNPKIETDVTPAYTSSFDYDYVLIFRFPNKRKAKAYVADSRIKVLWQNHRSKGVQQTTFISKRMSALPGMPKFADIDDTLLHPEPAFLLLNAIKMKKSPLAMFRMMKYFKRNYPSITESGTQYFSTFKVVKVIKGHFDFQMLFMTEWASMDAFMQVHNSENFRKNVHLRNRSFKAFTEGKGLIIK